jgi:hypothetical protein
MRPAARGLAFCAVGLAALSVAIVAAPFRFPAIAVAFVCFLLMATAQSRAGRISPALRSFVGRRVQVQVWGAPIPATGGSTRVDSVTALGVGLLIHLRASSEDRRTLLKVAQPGEARFEDDRLEIDDARYVSWGGKKLVPVPDRPALMIRREGLD